MGHMAKKGMAENEQTGRRRWPAVAVWGLLVAGVLVAFWPYFGEMWSRWFPRWDEADLGLYARLVEGESYYTHGPLIPLVSLVIALLLIGRTKIRARRNLPAGLVVLCGALLLYLTACFARVNFAQGFALVGVVAGLVLLLWGWPGLRRLWFPIAFLVFMIPLPEVTIGDLNFRLKMIATEAGVTLANAVGVIAESSGNQVFMLDDKSLTVANVCNGLRTLISLLAFGALYAYVCRLRGLWRLVLFAMSVPVAVVSNAVRITSLIVVADVWDVETATGWFHDGSGLMIYVLAFALMFSLERLILWAHKVAKRPMEVRGLFADVRRGPEDAGQWGRMARRAASGSGVTAVVLVGLTAGCIWHLKRAVPTTWDQNVAANAVPRELHVDGRPLIGHPQTMSRKTLGILETEDYFYSVYAGPGAPRVALCIIFSRDNRKGTHPPDQCLEGGGNEIVHKGDIVIRPDGMDREVPARELVIQRGQSREYFLYTYKCGKAYTGSFWRQQFIIFTNGLLRRDASGALIRVSSPVLESIAASREWCKRFMARAIPHIDRNLQPEAESQ